MPVDIPRTGRLAPTPSRPSTVDPLASPAGSCISLLPPPYNPGSEPSMQQTSSATPDSPRRLGPTQPPPEGSRRIPTRAATPRKLSSRQQCVRRASCFFLTFTCLRAHYCCCKLHRLPNKPRSTPSPVNTSAVCASPPNLPNSLQDSRTIEVLVNGLPLWSPGGSGRHPGQPVGRDGLPRRASGLASRQLAPGARVGPA